MPDPGGSSSEPPSALDAAQGELIEAGRRKQMIAQEKADVEAQLKQRKLNRKAKPVARGADRGRGGSGRGRGRMSSAEQRIENR
tara:strand:+ start:155 stop:406 length:252 start_codon:yes stop_codon:yes gene_type:complete